MTATDPRAAARRRQRLGPLFLLLPLLLLVLGLAHLWRREPETGSAPVPGVTSPDETVSALIGELGSDRGGWLVATLAPLHVDARRQALEAEALRAELGLGDGAPWRLTVRWDEATGEPRASEADTAPPGVAASGGDLAPRSAPAGIVLGAVRIEDGEGLALSSLEASGAPVDGQPVSPLRTLVSPPSGSLRPGETADWILWGRVPGEGAHLTGLVPDDDEVFWEATGLRGPFALKATRVRRGDLGQPLARLERGPAGKSGAGGASEVVDGDGLRNGH